MSSNKNPAPLFSCTIGEPDIAVTVAVVKAGGRFTLTVDHVIDGQIDKPRHFADLYAACIAAQADVESLVDDMCDHETEAPPEARSSRAN